MSTFLGLLTLSGLESADAAPWKVSTTVDEMTDQKTAVAYATSNDGRAGLYVRCESGAFEAFVAMARTVSHNDGGIEVMVRIDGGQPISFRATEGVDSDTVFFSDDQLDELTPRLMAASQAILVRVPNVWWAGDGATLDRTFSFPIVGSRGAIAQVRAACGLTSDPQPTVQWTYDPPFWSPHLVAADGTRFTAAERVPPGDYVIDVAWDDPATRAPGERVPAGKVTVTRQHTGVVVVVCDPETRSCAEGPSRETLRPGRIGSP